MPDFTIKTKLRELAEAHDPPLSIAQIVEQTGVSNNTVRRWYNNDYISRYEREVILVFYKYFNLASLDQLLEIRLEDSPK